MKFMLWKRETSFSSDHPKYYQKAIDSNASCVLLDQEVEFPEGKGILLSSQPFDDFIRLIRHF